MEDIKKGMNKIFNVSIATSVIILVLGIFLFIQPDTIIHMISIVLGGIILWQEVGFQEASAEEI